MMIALYLKEIVEKKAFVCISQTCSPEKKKMS